MTSWIASCVSMYLIVTSPLLNLKKSCFIAWGFRKYFTEHSLLGEFSSYFSSLKKWQWLPPAGTGLLHVGTFSVPGRRLWKADIVWTAPISAQTFDTIVLVASRDRKACSTDLRLSPRKDLKISLSFLRGSAVAGWAMPRMANPDCACLAKRSKCNSYCFWLVPPPPSN